MPPAVPPTVSGAAGCAGRNEMTDIHCHIIFGVDDGSDCLAESVEMARIADDSGTRWIAATPHANIPDSAGSYWGPAFEEKLAELNAAIEKARLGVRVFRGQEVFAAGDLTALVKSGDVITLNGSRYLLTEFDFYGRSEHMFSTCESLLAEGIVPIVAHPERYAAVQSDEDAAFTLREMGCLLQLNRGSLFGAFGKKAEDTAHRLLYETQADFIASDAHSPYMRTPFLEDAHAMVSELYSPDYADYLLRENPALALEDKDIESF